MAEDEHRRWLPSVCERVGVDDANTIQLFEMSGTTREGSSDIGQFECLLPRNIEDVRPGKTVPKCMEKKTSSVAVMKNGCSNLFVMVVICILMWSLIHFCLSLAAGLSIGPVNWNSYHTSEVSSGVKNDHLGQVNAAHTDPTPSVSVHQDATVPFVDFEAQQRLQKSTNDRAKAKQPVNKFTNQLADNKKPSQASAKPESQTVKVGRSFVKTSKDPASCPVCKDLIVVGQPVRIVKGDHPDRGSEGVVVRAGSSNFEVKITHSRSNNDVKARVVTNLSLVDLEKMWNFCVVVHDSEGARCKQPSELSTSLHEPPLVVWQTMLCACGTPNALQNENAKFLPAGTQIRWQDQPMAARLVRDIAYDIDVPGTCLNYFEMRSGTFRADVWRVAVLYRYGGLYMDHKNVLGRPVSEWIDLADRDLAWIPKEGEDLPRSFHNGAMYAGRPNLPLYRCIMDQINDNIETRYHPTDRKVVFDNILSITGPSAVFDGHQRYLRGQCGSAHSVQIRGRYHDDPKGKCSERWRRGAYACINDDADVGEKAPLMFYDRAIHDTSYSFFPRYDEIFYKKLSYCSTPYDPKLIEHTPYKDRNRCGCYAPEEVSGASPFEFTGNFGLPYNVHSNRVQSFCAFADPRIS